MEAATSSEKAQSTLLGPENPLTRSQDEPDEKVTSSSEMKDQMVIDEEIRTLKRKRKKRTNGGRKSVQPFKVKVKKEPTNDNYSNVNFTITSYQNNKEIEKVNSDSKKVSIYSYYT